MVKALTYYRDLENYIWTSRCVIGPASKFTRNRDYVDGMEHHWGAKNLEAVTSGFRNTPSDWPHHVNYGHRAKSHHLNCAPREAEPRSRNQQASSYRGQTMLSYLEYGFMHHVEPSGYNQWHVREICAGWMNCDAASKVRGSAKTWWQNDATMSSNHLEKACTGPDCTDQNKTVHPYGMNRSCYVLGCWHEWT